MRRIAIAFTVVFLLAIIGWQQYQINQMKRQAQKDDVQLVKELTIRQREDFCAAHIGKLTGSKHEATLKWFNSFSLEGQEHRMSEQDLKTCLEF